MPDPITFYYNPRSRAVMAHWMLEEVGADYRIEPIDFEKGDNRAPEFLAVNPMGKIPTIVVDGTPITETAAIITWLADAYPDAGLAPAVGSVERGSWYRWLYFGGSCIEPAMVDELFQRPPPPNPLALGWGGYDKVVDTLEQALDPGPYLLSATFSAADVYVGSLLVWAGLFGARRVTDSPVLTRYVAQVTARPAYQKTRLQSGN